MISFINSSIIFINIITNVNVHVHKKTYMSPTICVYGIQFVSENDFITKELYKKKPARIYLTPPNVRHIYFSHFHFGGAYWMSKLMLFF